MQLQLAAWPALASSATTASNPHSLTRSQSMTNQASDFDAVDDEVLGAASGGTNLSYT